MRTAFPACAVAALALAAASQARAFDFIVTEYTDDALILNPGCTESHCTLREAVIAANVGVDADRILLSAGVYALTILGSTEGLSGTGDLNVREDTEIVGVGAGITILDATGLGEQAFTADGAGLVFALRKVTVRNSDSIGAHLRTGSHTVEDCEFRDNDSTGLATNIESVVTLRRVSFHGNAGNGLAATQSTTTAENCTFSDNGGRELIVNAVVSFSCTNCTISDPADADPEVQVQSSTVGFANSIVAGNCFFASGGTITSSGGNVESPGNTCSFSQGTDLNTQTSVELDLAALADNGGPTPTHLPGAASVANANAVDALCLPLGDDQRGVAREKDCESGSVERTNAHVETPIFNDGFLQGDPEAWVVSP